MKTSANPCDPKNILAIRFYRITSCGLLPFKKSKMFPFPDMKPGPSKVIIYIYIQHIYRIPPGGLFLTEEKKQEATLCTKYHQTIYIYIPGTQMTLVLMGKGLVLGGLTFKNRGHLGSRYIYTSFPWHDIDTTPMEPSPRLSCPVGLLDVALGSNQPDGKKVPSRDFCGFLGSQRITSHISHSSKQRILDAQSGCCFFEVSLIQFLVAIFRFQLGASLGCKQPSHPSQEFGMKRYMEHDHSCSGNHWFLKLSSHLGVCVCVIHDSEYSQCVVEEFIIPSSKSFNPHQKIMSIWTGPWDNFHS